MTRSVSIVCVLLQVLDQIGLQVVCALEVAGKDGHQAPTQLQTWPRNATYSTRLNEGHILFERNTMHPKKLYAQQKYSKVGWLTTWDFCYWWFAWPAGSRLRPQVPGSCDRASRWCRWVLCSWRLWFVGNPPWTASQLQYKTNSKLWCRPSYCTCCFVIVYCTWEI